MNKKFLTVSGTALAAVIALSGCAAGGGMAGMNHGGSSPVVGTPMASAADHNAADTMFAQMMIPHHAQAVEMADVILKKQNIPAKVSALATKIKAEQAPEIEKMTGWLKGWKESATPSAGHTMDGMMGADEMKKLGAAQGPDAAKLFLTQMIAHHQGAVMMAKTQEADGQNSEAVALAKTIITSQQKEIQEMKDLLATL